MENKNNQDFHIDEILKREPTPDEARQVKKDQEARASGSLSSDTGTNLNDTNLSESSTDLGDSSSKQSK